ncbi:MAG: STAS domain-containing protein [Elusimicrobiaceae bacterium]|nr:STAS domain-containing protein [Elusimicrobiaceae bacterium]
MNIAIKKTGATSIVTVTGRMDAVTAPDFESKMTESIIGGDRKLVIILTGLEYISSAGLRAILAIAKRMRENQGQLVFAGLQGHVLEVFKISGFRSIFKIFDTEQEALTHLG